MGLIVRIVQPQISIKSSWFAPIEKKSPLSLVRADMHDADVLLLPCTYLAMPQLPCSYLAMPQLPRTYLAMPHLPLRANFALENSTLGTLSNLTACCYARKFAPTADSSLIE
jgi:hypothetical protein